MSSFTGELLEESRQAVVFQVSKIDSLADEPIKIVLHGTTPLSKITLRAESVTAPKYRFSAYGYFYTDEFGNVDLSSSPSIGGTYTGIDSMGLLWSLIPEKGQQKGLRFLPDIFKPINICIKAYSDHSVEFDKLIPFAKINIRRHFIADDVEYHSVRHGRIRGILFCPKHTSGKLPAILDMYGSGGGIMPHRAALFASKGFVALSLAYFKYEDLPKTLDRIDLEYFVEAVDYLRGLDCVQPGGIGAVGNSKGADIILQVAALTPHIAAVAFVNGVAFSMHSYFYWTGGQRKPRKVDWSKVLEDENGNLILRDCHWFDDGDISQVLPIEDVRGKILIFASDHDTNVPAVKSADILAKRLEQLGTRENCLIVELQGAGHILEPPYMPMCDAMYMKTTGSYVASMGGIPHLHHKAQLRYWSLLIDFFKANLSKQMQHKL